MFVITTDNSLCVADDENLSVTERICQLDPNRERLITGVNDLAYNHAVGRLYVQYYSELNREARPYLAAIDMDDGGLQHICELPVDVNTMAIDVVGGSKACYELGTFADGVWPVAGLMEPGEVQNHIVVIMPDQALATTSVPMNTATPPVTEPSCTEPGYTTYTCSCGESYVADHTDPLGHDWHGTDCSRCDEKRENPFVDVPNDSFFLESVLWAVERGITSGMDATHFGPGLACNRAQVVTFLWRAAGSPEPVSQGNPFVDVSAGDFYYKAVLWAVEAGITAGMDPTHFGPAQSCNRAQVVTFLWRSQGSPESDAAVSFTDVKTGEFYTSAVAWAVEEGVTTGIDTNTFGVSAVCNRAQVVTFLYRTLAE